MKVTKAQFDKESLAIQQLYDEVSRLLLGVDLAITVPVVLMSLESAALSASDGDIEKAVGFIEQFSCSMCERLRAGGHKEITVGSTH